MRETPKNQLPDTENAIATLRTALALASRYPRKLKTRRPSISLAGHIKVDEAAKLMNVSTKTLWRWHLDGVGPKRTIFKQRIFYNSSDVRNFIGCGD